MRSVLACNQSDKYNRVATELEVKDRLISYLHLKDLSDERVEYYLTNGHFREGRPQVQLRKGNDNGTGQGFID